ncbi:acetyl-CoA C-acetyltransferase [Salinibacillus kushneri]|uniref:acetyl-CoA C-acetyltransferase n=1 Tax=Salinibacillus kushneri TaxID=237682 RepID=A0A1I0ACE7_9BACI|nr:acetyl-CoA C-acetyltransferase [Salinibacillus kushneri]SES91355.1 acetyl-CoA C-acetyltransferase [Salinibacillus kushneri]
MEEVVIVGAARTPIGTFGGSLKNISAITLGKTALQEAMQRANLSPDEVNRVIFGHVLQAGVGQNSARQIAIHSGIPYEVPAMTINEVCGSGLKSVILGAQAIQLGEADVVAVGGTENMSQAPYLSPNHRFGQKMGDTHMVDSMVKDGLTDAFENVHMGVTAEKVAEEYCVSREEQDQFALESQKKAAFAQNNGRFKEEIVPVKVKTRKGEKLVSDDEHIRPDASLESLAKLKPAFVEDGTVTAGNSSGINDGAASLILMKKSMADERKIPYLGMINGYAEIGIDPSIMGYAPYYSLQKLFDKTGVDATEIDLFELNEAFASQSIAVTRDLGLNREKVNVNGGAIALGHPIGASGARILVTLLYEMQKQDVHRGVASLCVGGGIGISMQINR